jgi:hypothetical protein
MEGNRSYGLFIWAISDNGLYTIIVLIKLDHFLSTLIYEWALVCLYNIDLLSSSSINNKLIHEQSS